jgi:pyruvate/2-oxoglutarate dehydrogenase complex dihydrolipoamide dehydrogenase (E3) component
MIVSAAVAHQTRRAAEFAVRVPGPVSVDLAAVVDRKDRTVGKIRSERLPESIAEVNEFVVALLGAATPASGLCLLSE